MRTEINDLIEAALTSEDLEAWNDRAEATENVKALVEQYGVFQIWGSIEDGTLEVIMMDEGDA